MSQVDPAIVNITGVPKSEVASLHLRYLPTPFSGIPGSKLLERYYRGLCEDNNSFGFAAVMNGKTVGFSFAVKNTNYNRKSMVKRSPFFIFYWAFRQIIARPQLLVGLVRRLLRTKSKGGDTWHRPADLEGWYTYRPIVVDEPYRKCRVADLLTKQLIEEARCRNIPGILAVVAQSNIGSLRHFSRNNFFEVWKCKDFTVFGKDLGIQRKEEMQR